MTTKDTRKTSAGAHEKNKTGSTAASSKKNGKTGKTTTKTAKKAAIIKDGKSTEKLNEKFYDVVIIGAGPAGLSAAIEAGSYNKQVALLDMNDSGGWISAAPSVYGIPGLPGISGREFTTNLFNHISLLPTVDYIQHNAIYINYRYGMFRVTIDDNSLVCGKSLIFATGKEYAKQQCETLEKKYLGELSFTISDADDEIFADSDVVVLGNDKEAAEYALELSTYCNKVYMLLGQGYLNLTCPPALADEVTNTKNIQVLANSTTFRVTKDQNVPHILHITTSLGSVILCKRVYAPISQLLWHSNTDIVGIFANKDDKGYIISSDTATDKVPGVFAAGTCRTGSYSVMVAINDGINSAKKAIEFVNNLNNLAGK